MNASDAYQKTADILRRAVREKVGPRDPAANLLTLAANQLENAADNARMLENLIHDGKVETMIDPNKRPRNVGQWEGERDAAERSTFRQGMIAGALVVALAWLVIEVVA